MQIDESDPEWQAELEKLRRAFIAGRAKASLPSVPEASSASGTTGQSGPPSALSKAPPASLGIPPPPAQAPTAQATRIATALQKAAATLVHRDVRESSAPIQSHRAHL